MVIAVASGKGGTGKTTVATNLALALSCTHQVQYLDCDVEEPNAHIFLKPHLETSEPVEIPVPKVNEERCHHCGLCADICPLHALAVFKDQVLFFPELCHGCGACSALCPMQAITEVGRPIGVVETGVADGLEDRGEIGFAHGYLNVGEAFSPPVVKAVRKKAAAPLVILDVAPGTSCPVVEALKGADFCLLVTEETPFGVHDLELITQVVKKLGIPAGVVINRVDMRPPGRLPELVSFCKSEGLPILMEIPDSRYVAELYSRGEPLVKASPEWSGKFEGLYAKMQRQMGLPCGK